MTAHACNAADSLLEWIPMSDDSIVLPPGDDTSTEITTPIGFSFGGPPLHHQIYVS